MAKDSLKLDSAQPSMNLPSPMSMSTSAAGLVSEAPGLQPIGEVRALSVKPVSAAHTKPAESLRKTYWFGTKESCPFWNFSIKGHTFPRHTDRVFEKKGSTDTQFVEQDGGIEAMTDERRDQILEAVSRAVIRPSKRPEWFYVDDKFYDPDPTDYPAGSDLYFCEVPAGMSFERSAAKATPLTK
jgi:hypothetical protein